MTQEQKRIKLAEASGWIYDPQEEYSWQDPEGEGYRYPRDYFNDLNAVHKLWNTLIKGNDELEDKLSIELLRQIGSDDPSNGGRPNGSDATWALASNATAAQRAEAIGLTLSLWEASK